MQKQRLLITGGTGLLGLNWALIARAQYEVTLLQNQRRVFLAGVKNEYADIRMSNEVKRVFHKVRPDLVVHTAGFTNIEGCEHYPEEAYSINVIGSRLVAEFSHIYNSQLIHISTDHLSDGELPMLDESTSPSPLNQYGRTKLLAEEVVLAANPYALVLRTNFFGWGPSYRSSFSDFIINNLTYGKSITLFDDVHYTPILIEYLVNIGHMLVEKNLSGVFNAVGEERLSKFEFGLKLAKRIGANSQLINRGSISIRDELVNRPRDMSLSNKKLTNSLGRHVGTCDEMIDRLLQNAHYELFKEVKNL